MEKGTKSSKIMKFAVAIFSIGFGFVSFEVFMRLVYMEQKYMARWHMWVWGVVGVAFLIPAFILFYASNKAREEERQAYFEEYFEEEEKNISVEK